jgi:Ca2+/H+ antiporter
MERSEIAEIICDAHKRSGANCRNTNIKVVTNTLAQLLNWLLVFVPVAVVLRVWPQPGNETALFICSCFAVVPLAGWMGRAPKRPVSNLASGD